MHPRKITDCDRRMGALICSLRKAKGLTQTDLGAALGVTFQQVQKYEKGTNRIAANRLRDIAKCLGIQQRDLFWEIYGQEEEGERLHVLSAEALQVANAFDAIPAGQLKRSLLNLVLTAGAPQTAEAA